MAVMPGARGRGIIPIIERRLVQLGSEKSAAFCPPTYRRAFFCPVFVRGNCFWLAELVQIGANSGTNHANRLGKREFIPKYVRRLFYNLSS